MMVALALAACTDTLDFQPGNTIDSDGNVSLVMDVPAPVSRLSRAVDPEYQVDDVTVLIYTGDNDNTFPAQVEKIFIDATKNTSPNALRAIDDTKYNLSFRLDAALRGKSDLRFYFFANSALALNAFTESSLATTTTTELTVQSADGVTLPVMCGKASATQVLSKTTIPLYRNAAKVSVTDAVPYPAPDELNYFPYELYGAATQSPVMAGVLTADNLGESSLTTPSQSATDVTTLAPMLFHPTVNDENAIGIGGNLFIITKASFAGTVYFYRLDFVKTETQGDEEVTTYINAEPNHWYQFVILDVESPGYATPAEAALHPDNGVKYKIHDHSPVSFNMQSDGFRELGVSHLINFTGYPATADEWSDAEVYVKFFSKDPSEVPAAAAVMPLITVDDPSWLEISTPELVTDPDVTGGSGAGDDANDEGTVYRFKLRFSQTNLIGTLYNKITVSWMGLEREVPVVWERSFNGADISSVKLTMKYSGSSSVIADYWEFLASTDDPEGTKVNALWGIQTTANNGKVRNQGFHFPVMYGSGTNLATYSYDLVFDEQDKFKKSNVKSLEVKVLDDTHVTCTATDNDDYYAYTITRDNTDRYQYTVGSIRFTFTYLDNTKEVYTFSTYHTGFFHKDGQLHRLDARDANNYYYYEVVPVMIGNKTQYMLDRNLAAKSAEMYVRDSEGYTEMGNPAAAGGYYTVAYQEWAGNHSAYKDPVMYDDTTDRVSPPGYRVPYKNAWDALRISTSFHNEAVGKYFPVYYVTGNPLIGNVYFPKSMLYNNGTRSIMGESRSGYYWTGTAASGTEKDEIGKWLNMLVLTGSSSTYANGCVMIPSDPSLAYGASVRCINDVPDDSQSMVTSFNVSGVTHVYLYTEEGGGTPTTAWPGHPIGNYATMSGDQWFGFTYESTQFSPDQLYVIFNFVDEAGRIYTYSRKSDGTTQCTTTLSPKQCMGWKVVGDDNANIVPHDGYTTVDNVALMPAFETALGNWWRCGGRGTGAPFVYDYQSAPRTLYLVGGATPGGWDLDKATPINTTTPGVYKTEIDLEKGEFKACFVPDFNMDFLRPIVNLTEISADGVANHGMGEWKQTTAATDFMWRVVTAGKYELTFDINNMTFDARLISRTYPSILYLVGAATPGGWDLDKATAITSSSPGVFTTEINLSTGEFKACFELNWASDFLRPVVNQTQVSADGVANHSMGEWKESVGPDYKWYVVTAGRYKLTFDLVNMTFDAQYIYEPEPADGYIRIIINNYSNWPQVNLWYWQDTPVINEYGNTWPGPMLSRVPGSTTQWYIDIPDDVQCILYSNNGSPKSPDIRLPGGSRIYEYSN